MLNRASTIPLFQNKSLFEKNPSTFIEFLRQMPVPGLLKDINGKYLFANQAYCKLLEIEAETAPGQKDQDLFDEETAFILSLGDSDVIKYGLSFQQTHSITIHGTELYLKISKFPIRKVNQSGMVGCIITDVTEKVNNDKEKNELQQQLIQAQKMETIGILASGIAHDFNNILTPVLAFTDTIQRELPRDSYAYKMSGGVKKVVGMSQEMVSQMFAFCRKDTVKKERIHLKKTIKEILDFIQISLPRNIKIHTHFTANLDIMMGNQTQIHQIVMNLYTNAVQALKTNNGDITVAIENHTPIQKGVVQISESPFPTHIKLTVTDTGDGIPESAMESIFDPFFTTKGKDSGTGLGLHMVNKIVGDHGGSIAVSNNPDGGAQFEISFPLMMGANAK